METIRLKMLRLPQDVVRNETIVSILGKTRVKVENYGSILIYCDTRIRLRTKTGQMEIEGKKLKIRYYDREEMEITGQIE